jgi:hypothetical protein
MALTMMDVATSQDILSRKAPFPGIFPVADRRMRRYRASVCDIGRITHNRQAAMLALPPGFLCAE